MCFLNKNSLLMLVIAGLLGSTNSFAGIAQTPLYLSQSAAPRILFAMSNDHQQFVKAYTDYTDLDDDGVLDFTYQDSFDYYGYFDSAKCYLYDSTDKRFEPDGTAGGTNGHECNGNNKQWSGNWLNWATMTRMDIVRKVLYGGKRSTDTADETVLERAYLPSDVHSFAKVFKKEKASQVHKFTPYDDKSITVCNTSFVSNTETSGSISTLDYPPLMQVAIGDFPQWALSEKHQCGFRGNDNTASEMTRPHKDNDKDKDLGSDFVVRVQVCDASLPEGNCKAYASLKPTGLLQQYGEDSAALKMNFGLITGSYEKNLSGGVLRKNIIPFAGNDDADQDEIDSGSGIVKYLVSDTAVKGIIHSLDSFRIYGRKGGSYNTRVNDWGNPLSEIYLEGLRYLSGQRKKANVDFAADDSGFITALPTAAEMPAWVDPLSEDEWCADLSVITLSTGLNSFDTDDLSSDISGLDIRAMTNEVGRLEGMNGNDYYIGENLSDSNRKCTAKTIHNLADVKGICPEVPGKQGGYHIAGMAHYAKTHDIRPDITPEDGEARQSVTTYAVALAETMPRFEVPVAGGKVTIIPYCTDRKDDDTKPWAVPKDCTMTGLRVLSLNPEGTRGEIDVSWEDKPRGADYDMDVIAHIAFCAEDACDDNPGAGKLRVSTEIRLVKTTAPKWLGYFIEGTTDDGRHLPLTRNGSGNEDERQDITPYITSSTPGYPDPYIYPANDSNNLAYEDPNVLVNTQVFSQGNSVGAFLENPLWYTAKYGAFIEQNDLEDPKPDLAEEWDIDSDGVPDGFFNARNPSKLFNSLSNVIADIVKRESSNTSVAANSTQLGTDSKIYQARFYSGDWSGDLLAFALDPESESLVSFSEPVWNAADRIPDANKRAIFTSTGAFLKSGVSFKYGNLSEDQKVFITEAQVDYLRGDRSREQDQFRQRSSVLGDIINSNPLYVGQDNFNYYQLELAADKSSTYRNYLTGTGSLDKNSRQDMIYVGANDGMLHGFLGKGEQGNCTPGAKLCEGEELFAYIPKGLFNQPYAGDSGLASLTQPAYQHRYYVDGSPRHGDAYIRYEETIARWGTALVGTLAGGGKGIFALDVSNPDSFTDDDVLWDLDETDLGSNLGYTFGQASIVKLANGKWGAVFGNGYYSESRDAVLMIVDLETGELIKEIATQSVPFGAEANGLSSPQVVDTTGDKIADTVYAGDLQGNLWKFDISSNESDNWGVWKPDATSLEEPLFTACAAVSCGLNNRQPITTRPRAVKTPSGGLMLLFGTGRYMELTDTEDSSVQSFYGIYDDDISVLSGRSKLVSQTIIKEYSSEDLLLLTPPVVSPNDLRVTSDNQISLKTDRGWYMDFKQSDYPGERIVSNPLILGDSVIFPTIVPEPGACSDGGSSWLMELNALSGGRPEITDVNGDGVIDDKDLVEGVPVSGRKYDALINESLVLDEGENLVILTPDTELNLNEQVRAKDKISGRKSWLQIK
ncbi:pilus assembly protein [Amphritea balenae]|uniref:PilY1 beta-propeller domain-containing protein n=1 Tax=Amphritea balenae TaxID=452629 RepID=A0A3P1SP85_9GAMM|nr:PilC/PilY family type IV pilus protein [Amphritea balenae]RRC98784.1 hypothetical protein EHS89_11370 [Amphritea balenae]GGK61652.1 hypothetical protein GCM10007941_09730 [Amphritea balenae]